MRGRASRAGLARDRGRASLARRDAGSRARAPPSCCSPRTRPTRERLWGAPNPSPYVKDGFDDYVVGGRPDAVNPARAGTKAAAHYRLRPGSGERPRRCACACRDDRAAGRSRSARLRRHVFAERIAEADAFYAALRRRPRAPRTPGGCSARPSPGCSGASSSTTTTSSAGSTAIAPSRPPPAARWHGRNHEWRHLNNADVISMPDKWEYPWYAAWDLAFHCIPLALIDPGVRQGAADPVPARVVHAPQRPDPRLRVGVRRRQSARPRLGGLARLQDRPPA